MTSTRVLLRSLLAAAFFTTSAIADPVEDAVKDIRAKYNQIAGAKLDTHGFGAVELGGAVETYFYHIGQLFFIYVAQSSWRFTGNTLASGESETVDSLIEHRLYFANGGLIRHLRKEVESTNYDALGGLIAKVPNQPHEDPALASAAKMRGFQIPGVGSWQDVATMLAY